MWCPGCSQEVESKCHQWMCPISRDEREKMNIRIQTRVNDVIEKEIVTGGKKDENDKAILSYQKVGWFLHFEGSYEALFVGYEKPEGFEKGTEVDIILIPRTK